MRLLNTIGCGMLLLTGMALGASAQDTPFATKVVAMEYPRLAVLAGMTGTTMLQVRVDDSGKVIRATGVFGWPLLIKQAKANLMLWTFSPRRSAGGKARSDFDFAYDFELKGEPQYNPRPWQTFTYEYPNKVTIVSPPSTLLITPSQPAARQESK